GGTWWRRRGRSAPRSAARPRTAGCRGGSPDRIAWSPGGSTPLSRLRFELLDEHRHPSGREVDEPLLQVGVDAVVVGRRPPAQPEVERLVANQPDVAPSEEDGGDARGQRHAGGQRDDVVRAVEQVVPLVVPLGGYDREGDIGAER